MQFTILIRKLCNAVMWISVSCFLASCAFSPGMKFDAGYEGGAANGLSSAEVTPITLAMIQASQQSGERPLADGLKQLLGVPAPYLIGPSDVLSIVVWDHPELVYPTLTYGGSGSMGITDPGDGQSALAVAGGGGGGAASVPGYVVSPDGFIQFPYIGLFKASGLTQLQVRERLIHRLSEFVTAPQITVRVTSFRNQRVFIDGQVKSPGVQPIDDVPMTLVEALSRAGGVLPSGDASDIRISRAGRTVEVSLPDLLKRGIDPGRIVLKDGDIVHVSPREDRKVFVAGEVLRPGPMLLRDGHLSLNEALGAAGGVNPQTSDPGQIYVIRQVGKGKPEVFHLDSKSPVALAIADGFDLRENDVVYVDAASLTRWSRATSLMLPTTQPFVGTATALR
ncbi:polysaccharide biosynthesis/export family protein [Caballeronia sp. LjRoot34]|uniref:polysaccharide biosynthesis/export family protein n=1 Tax=Caballeronia sp. LjRoot34 TaxID=3342325 RepID=UPI003ECD6E51